MELISLKKEFDRTKLMNKLEEFFFMAAKRQNIKINE